MLSFFTRDVLDEILILIESVSEGFPTYSSMCVCIVLGRAYRCLTGGFLLLRNFSVAISASPHVCLS